jgi:hypothetical protein
MSSTSALYLFALLASAAALLRLPTRLLELLEPAADVVFGLALAVPPLLLLFSRWIRPPPAFVTVAARRTVSWMVSGLLVVIDCVRSLGSLPEYVDCLLRDEELRSRLEPELDALRTAYKTQQATLASLNRRLAEVWKEYYDRCREFPTVFFPRRRLEVPAAKYQDTKWSEPHTVFKMCKCLFSLVVSSSASPVYFCRLHVISMDPSANPQFAAHCCPLFSTPPQHPLFLVH